MSEGMLALINRELLGEEVDKRTAIHKYPSKNYQ
jgi:hypothetical protein